ncbi:MAG TPA: CBS domain-containing protein [Vicinamibacterales bacterium]|jgi:CBS domain-containing protein|nr:CBS domain-containing protein [Vicinamibacterales bacterium]
MSDTVAALLRHKGNRVWSASPDDSVLQAIALMADKGVGALVVLQGEAVVGMISERDYARKVVLQGRSSKDTLVSDIMTSPVCSVGPEHTIDECMRLVTAERIRHLPVVESGKVVGMVSIGDLVRRLVSIQGETIQYLHEYIAGPHSVHRNH